MRRKMFVMFGLGVGVAALPLYLVACMFPTTADVNTLTLADHEFVAGEHKEIRDQMTAEHGIQTPEVLELLSQVNADAAAAVKLLRTRVDSIEAKGAQLSDFGEFGGMNDWITGLAALLSGGSIWGVISGLFKPSRATARIDGLEKSITDRIAALELKLATAAKAGAPIPSDGPGLQPATT